jgi:hypothetical protein
MELKETKTVNTSDGELKVINGFNCQEENRLISLAILEDESIVISIQRYEENEEQPYTELITNQFMRLSKLSVALLMACLLKANVDFEIDADSIIRELNNKNKK